MASSTASEPRSSDAGGPSSGRSYAIDAAVPAARGVAIILETLLEAIRSTEAGVAERRGEEFLHDYRVAVRRTRSALGLYARVLPAPMRRRGKKLFGDLGRRTGDARDLDVLLLALPGYLEEVAAEDAEGARLEQRIELELGRHYAAIGRWIAGRTYGRTMASWRADVDALATSEAGGPIAELAAAAIGAAADRTANQLAAAGGEDPDAALHRLRIRFKRLRYALEFSSALAPGGEVDNVIGTLKDIQDRLGSHQDLVVHERWIGEFCALRGGSALAPLGRRLLASLQQQRGRLRASIEAEAPRLHAALAAGLDRARAALV